MTQAFESEKAIKVAVVTGAEPINVPQFTRFVRDLRGGIEAYIQHMDDFSYDLPKIRKVYDVVLLYMMFSKTPSEERGVMPWYARHQKKAILELGETEQGIFVLHHGLLAYPEWPIWADIVGLRYDPAKSEVSMNERLRIEIADADHPITKGLAPFDIGEETYKIPDAGDGSHVLLTTNHPKSLTTIAWTRQYKNSRVFCMQLGHDMQAYDNPNFRILVERGIQWCARRI